MLYLHTHPEPDDPFYLTELEIDKIEPEPRVFGDDELSPEEFEQVLEEQATMQRTMAALEALGFMTATIHLDRQSMAHVPDSVLGLD